MFFNKKSTEAVTATEFNKINNSKIYLEGKFLKSSGLIGQTSVLLDKIETVSVSQDIKNHLSLNKEKILAKVSIVGCGTTLATLYVGTNLAFEVQEWILDKLPNQ